MKTEGKSKELKFSSHFTTNTLVATGYKLKTKKTETEHFHLSINI